MVYRDGAEVARSPTTTYSDTGLAPSTTYTYRVSAVNGDSIEGSDSSPINVTTLDPVAPPPPANLSATTVSASEIDLAWTAPDANDLIGYRVYRNGDLVAEPTGTTYRDSGLQAFTTYNYTVTARDNEGLESDPSGSAQATTLDGTPPTRPENLTATATGTTSIGLSWSGSADPESGVVGYRVYRNGTQVAQTAGTTYVDTGLSPATTYEYRVSAVNGQGLESDRSNRASATTLDASPPTVPQNLTTSPVGTERIDLSWTASEDPESGVAEYLVFRDDSQVGTTAQTVFQDDGLTPATEYDYYVVAVNGDGLQSQPSTTVSARTFDGTGPTAPTELTATAVATDRIDLTWSPAQDEETGIAAYKVFRDGLEVATTTETSYQDSGLSPATEYEYRVSAVNGDGLQGSLSDPASATTLDGSGPTAPTNVEATTISQTQVDLTWTASEDPETGVEQYNVYRDGAVVGTVVSTSFADTGLQQNTTYVYTISAVNGEGIEGERSQSVSARTFPAEGAIPPAPPTGLRTVTP